MSSDRVRRHRRKKYQDRLVDWWNKQAEIYPDFTGHMIEAGSLPGIHTGRETWLTAVPKAFQKAEDAVRETYWVQQRRYPPWPRNERRDQEIAASPGRFRGPDDWIRFWHGLLDFAGSISGVGGSAPIKLEALRKNIEADLRLLRKAERGETWAGVAAILELRKKQARGQRTTRDARLRYLQIDGKRLLRLTAWPASGGRRLSPIGYAVPKIRAPRQLDRQWLDTRRLPPSLEAQARATSKRSLREHDARDRRRGTFFGYHYLARENGHRWAASVPEKYPGVWALKHVEQPALLLADRCREVRDRADAAICGLMSNFGFAA